VFKKYKNIYSLHNAKEVLVQAQRILKKNFNAQTTWQRFSEYCNLSPR